mgnify:CR=1 FL=1
MKKKLFLACCAVAMMAQAQTARKLTFNITPDGQANMVGYLPEQPTGRAIVGCPGGGYSHLSMQNEGHDWAEYFNRQGIAYFVLTYRMPKGDRTIPMSDAQTAIRTVRDSAGVWGINPYDVGIMGFSAGGHLASTVSTHSSLIERPDFSILFYPVISMDERATHKGSVDGFLGKQKSDKQLVRDFSNQNAVRRHVTPPAIILLANDDRAVPPVTNGIAYYSAMRNAGNECALHVYPTGGHGFGFRSNFKYHEQMLSDLTTWLKSHKAPKPDAVKVACIGNSITDGHGIDMASQLGYPAQLQQLLGNDYWVKNLGVSSRTMLNRGDHPWMKETVWADAQLWKPDVVVIKLGTNDSKPENWQYGQEFEQDLRTMITILRPDLATVKKKMTKKQRLAAATAKPKIYVCTPIPAFKPTWNISDSVIVNAIIPIQQRIASEYGLEVIDLHSRFAADGDKMLNDGIHPDQKGARRLAEIIAETIKQ